MLAVETSPTLQPARVKGTHGADANTGEKPRWGYIVAYFPADTLYNGAPNHNFDGLGLTPNTTIRHERFPIIYP